MYHWLVGQHLIDAREFTSTVLSVEAKGRPRVTKKKLTLFVFELDDTADRPEDFLLYDVHIGCRVGEYGRLNEVSFGAVTFSAKMDRSALGLAYINEVHHALGDTHEIAKERKERTTKSMEHTHQIVS